MKRHKGDLNVDKLEHLLNVSIKYHIEKIKYNSYFKLLNVSIINEVHAALNDIHEKLGGTPEIIIQFYDKESPKYDTFVDSMIGELSVSLRKSLETVKKANVYYRLSFFSEYMENEDLANFLMESYNQEFWDYLEMSYIRLASTWDRIGGLLEFCFFNIRQYDRDGFLSTIRKIHVNIVPMYLDLQKSESWKRLWSYSKSEKSDGLKWLLTRRNIVIHQTGIQELEDFKVLEEGDSFSKYNHILDKTVKEKLKPMPKDKELGKLVKHLEKTFRIFRDIKVICNMGVKVIPRIK